MLWTLGISGSTGLSFSCWGGLPPLVVAVADSGSVRGGIVRAAYKAFRSIGC